MPSVLWWGVPTGSRLRRKIFFLNVRSPLEEFDTDLSTFGLVIQGPLRSRGVNGEGTRETYDCVQNILDLIENTSPFFGEVLVSTWEDEDPVQLDKLEVAGARIVQSPRLDQEADGASRFRQYVTSLAGIDALADEMDYACKVRTDQSFDIPRFCAQLLDANEHHRDYLALGRKGFIQALFISLRRPFGLSDFALAGHRSELRDFYRSQWVREPLPDPANDWVEGDAVKRYLSSIKTTLPLRDDVYLFPPLPRLMDRPIAGSAPQLKSEASFRHWETALRGVFTVSSAEIMAGFFYRGSLLAPHFQVSNGHRSEWERLRLDFPAVLNDLVGPVVSIKPPRMWEVYHRGGVWRRLFWSMKTWRKVLSYKNFWWRFSR